MTSLRRALWLFAAWMVTAYCQSPADFERSVRAAMAPSLAQQQISVQKQVVSAARTRSAANASPFFEPGFPVTASLLADCDPMPPDQLDGLIQDSAKKEGVSPNLVHAVIEQESAARPCAVSYSGAQGLMQLMPATAEQFEVKDAFDPRQNVEAGTKLLKLLLNRYDNDLPLALGAYNAGPARVDREGGIPPIPETLNYVERILELLQKKDDKPFPPTAPQGAEDRPKQ
jgi:soluble lytic murein transglycosylase-like protein